MSAPPPYQYQYQQPQGPPPQYQQYQQYQAPPPPRGPQRPQQGGPLRGLIAAVLVLAVFGGVGWYVYDYNTDPDGGKAKAEASRSARIEEQKTHDPQQGNCVKIEGTDDDPLPTIVDCGSPEAEYRTGKRLFGPDKECPAQYDYGIQYSSNRGGDHTMCFTEV
ncbi:hypothetical protein AN217_08325 [Streptomyces qinglanensis]|uniref:Uncharacterized protein n=1 Tax=Streptomyces qinglanensis TaxID=943816 RepID=A0A1E7K1N6_9ACTN|nr:hypothetical protein [Streptomyces qinglanensis]OEU97857.1 hypothetical protein AN217_08325 [Streptomyces qinglanensis]OEV07399.1 hypothetical protein AN220_34355 [Streptomyces nanshensis]